MRLPTKIVMALLLGILAILSRAFTRHSEFSSGWWDDLERAEGRKGWDGPAWRTPNEVKQMRGEK